MLFEAMKVTGKVEARAPESYSVSLFRKFQESVLNRHEARS